MYALYKVRSDWHKFYEVLFVSEYTHRLIVRSRLYKENLLTEDELEDLDNDCEDFLVILKVELL